MTTPRLNLPDLPVHIGGYAHVPANEILFCQSESNYTHVHFVKKNKITVATTLKTLENRLITSGFVRVSRSGLVNWKYIKSYDSCLVTLVSGISLPIARRRRKKVLLLLGMYAELFQDQKLKFSW